MSFENVFHVRPIGRCNLFCDHCYLELGDEPMTLEEIGQIPSMIAMRCGLQTRAKLIWRGGEPTLGGVAFLSAALEAVEQEAGKFELALVNTLQTNLMFYSKELGDLFHRKLNGEILVSWDCAVRKLRVRGELSHDRYESAFKRNLEAALRDGLAVDLVVTVTKPLIEEWPPERLLERFGREGVRSIRFDRLLKIGKAAENWGEIGVGDMCYRSYVDAAKRFCDEANLKEWLIEVADPPRFDGREFTIDSAGCHVGVRYADPVPHE